METPRPNGYAVQVLRRYRRPNGSLTAGDPVNFWHVPLGAAPRDGAYEGLPHVQPINATRYPALVFASEFEAEVAVSYFNALWGRTATPDGWREDVYPGEYAARVRAVRAAPRHRLTDEGFAPMVQPSLFEAAP